jgi:lysophospholipid acyltransferase (LPLAT)-like uncharacterized protein
MGRGLLKTFGRQPAVQGALSSLAAGHIGAVKATTRWTHINSDVAKKAWAGDEPVIVAFWHNRLLLMPYCWPSRAPFHMLISSHPDGRLISRTVAHFGIDTIAGSSRRGGLEALIGMVRKLRHGESVGITPDGPRGPRMRAGDGPIALARISGATIIPAAASVSRRIVLNTWDKLIIALPFGQGATVWGEPIRISRGASPEDMADARLRLENALTRVTNTADETVGVPLTPPAEEQRNHAAA